MELTKTEIKYKLLDVQSKLERALNQLPEITDPFNYCESYIKMSIDKIDEIIIHIGE